MKERSWTNIWKMVMRIVHRGNPLSALLEIDPRRYAET
jgi:hypothetical protein